MFDVKLPKVSTHQLQHIGFLFDQYADWDSELKDKQVKDKRFTMHRASTPVGALLLLFIDVVLPEESIQDTLRLDLQKALSNALKDFLGKVRGSCIAWWWDHSQGHGFIIHFN